MTDKARAADSARKENRDLIPEFKASRDDAYSFGQIVKLNCTCSKYYICMAICIDRYFSVVKEGGLFLICVPSLFLGLSFLELYFQPCALAEWFCLQMIGALYADVYLHHVDDRPQLVRYL